MELRHLRYFVAVAEELNFSRAAERLHVAQPPLSQQIRDLERELGLTLFDRSKRRIALTQAGSVFLEHAYRVLADVERAVDAAQRTAQGEVGRLVIGFFSTVLYNVAAVPLALDQFRRRFPDVQLELRELTTRAQIDELRHGRIDVGLARRPFEDDASIAAEMIVREPYVVALPAHHALAGKRAIHLRELASQPFILVSRTLASGFRDEIVGLCRQAGFNPNIVQEAAQLQTIVHFIAAGAGISLLPQSILDPDTPGIVTRPLARRAAYSELVVMWRREDGSKTVDAFVSCIRRAARRTRREVSRE